MRNYNLSSEVEKEGVRKYGRKMLYLPYEKVKTLEVPNFTAMGKVAALRFIEWLQKNPGGVISLPTGKTPQYFIEWTSHFLSGWKNRKVAAELDRWGLSTARPDMKSFWFVQIDEFYPIDPARENSFSHYIRKFYIKGFGLDRKKCLLMDTWTRGTAEGMTLGEIFPECKADLSLRHRSPKNEAESHQQKAIYEADSFAMDYENRIAELGGIGFFLGGIGPDGHIAFNIRGSDHNSTTRVLNINYETAAASATDMGGIEMSRNKAVLTVGLATITRNPSATAIIMAAGEGKADVIRHSVEDDPSILYPATCLQKIGGSRFYVTSGAACMLTGRKQARLKAYSKIPCREKESIVTDITARLDKPIEMVTLSDLKHDINGSVLLEKETGFNLEKLVGEITLNYSERIARGVQEIKNTSFLHTAPHHDDIMLGYLPYILHLVRQPTNFHYFATLSSGFSSITNSYTLSMLSNLEAFISTPGFTKIFANEKDYFDPGNIVAKNRDVYQYLDGVAANSPEMRREGEARRTFRNICEISGTIHKKEVMKKADFLKRQLLGSYPGKKDIGEIQMLKGMLREWEEELLWAHLGFSCDNIYHLRLGFYTGDIFSSRPQWKRDVRPFLSLLHRLKPDVVTVAFDPEGTGPDTHYKVLQIVASAIKSYSRTAGKGLKIWGYRNVWQRFHPSEANIYVPVSMNSLAIMKRAFEICFASQKSASFPSPEYDGPFSELACKIMIEQGSAIKKVLGSAFFGGSPFARIRASRGVNLIREMDVEEFLQEAHVLRRLME